MTRDEIIRMAREADPYGSAGRLYELAEINPDLICAFAALVAAAEREECAKLCDSLAALQAEPARTLRMANPATTCAQAIRARGAA